MLPAEGQTTASVSPTATAASIALPPRFKTSTPTLEAISLTEATMPCLPRAGGREADSAVGGALSCAGAQANEKKSAKQRQTTNDLRAIIGLLHSNAICE